MEGVRKKPSLLDVLLIPKVFFIDGVAWCSYASFKNSWERMANHRKPSSLLLTKVLVLSLLWGATGAVYGTVIGTYLTIWLLNGQKVEVW